MVRYLRNCLLFVLLTIAGTSALAVPVLEEKIDGTVELESISSLDASAISVPAPSSLALAAIGLSGLWFGRRRKFRLQAK